MNYQTFIDMLRDTAVAVNATGTFANVAGNLTVLTGKKEAGKFYNSPSPQIFPVSISSQRDSLLNTRIWTVGILFTDQDRPDTNEDEREAIKSDMDVLVTQFLNYMTSHYKVSCRIIDNPEEKVLPGTYTGWFGNFIITTLNQC